MKHGVATTMMEQIYVGGMTMKGERYVMSSTNMEMDENNDSRSWMR